MAADGSAPGTRPAVIVQDARGQFADRAPVAAAPRPVSDEPSAGLHPRDVATLTGVLDQLPDAGATIIVIDHDLDLPGRPGRRP